MWFFILQKISGTNGNFEKEITETSEIMELRGNCTLPPIYPTKNDKDDYIKEEVLMFDKMHKEKIKFSDAILVVNF